MTNSHHNSKTLKNLWIKGKILLCLLIGIIRFRVFRGSLILVLWSKKMLITSRPNLMESQKIHLQLRQNQIKFFRNLLNHRKISLEPYRLQCLRDKRLESQVHHKVWEKAIQANQVQLMSNFLSFKEQNNGLLYIQDHRESRLGLKWLDNG